MTILKEDITFKFSDETEYRTLAEGCPPPIIEPPTKPDPCQMGFKMGDELAKTVARLTVPKLN